MQRPNFSKHVTSLPRNVTEGGGARNSAFATLLNQDGAVQHIIFQDGIYSRLLGFLQIMIRLYRWRNERIFLHYSTFQSLLGVRLLSSFPLRWLVCSLLKQAATRNLVFLEVNDLPYEQAFDLELPLNNLKEFDQLLFAIREVYFVFASLEMRDYAINKYRIERQRAMCIVNGAWPILGLERGDVESCTESLKIVYAGTINKGRQIRDMILSMVYSPHRLFLVGPGGEWINAEFGEVGNITYVGVMPEREAADFVSKCDLGLIPYPDDRFYYNLCLPSKAPFYALAGIPFLSTQLVELKKHFSYPHAFFLSLDEWRAFLASKDCVVKVRSARFDIRKNECSAFLWSTLWNEFCDSIAPTLAEHL
jgi:hypothetical protein